VTHTDAVAAAPWLDLSVVTGSIDMVSICAHKLGALSTVVPSSCEMTCL